MSAEIVNLNKARKARARGEEQQRAEENRVRFGRTKAGKITELQEKHKRDLTLDGAHLADDADNSDTDKNK